MPNQEHESLQGLTEEQLKSLEQYVKDDTYDTTFKPKTNFYIDLQYIQDIRLNAILSLCQNPEEYNYVLNQLPQYNERVIDTFTEFFPDLNIKETELEAYVADPKYTEFFIRTSPFTSAYAQLHRQLQIFHMHNLHLGMASPRYDIYVNIHPFALDVSSYSDKEQLIRIKTILKQRFLCFYPNVGVTAITTPPSEMTTSFIKKIHCFFILDIRPLFKSDDDPERESYVCERGGLYSTRIYTPKRCFPRRPDLLFDPGNDPEVDQLFDRADALMNMMSSFSYYTPYILTQDDPKGSGDGV